MHLRALVEGCGGRLPVGPVAKPIAGPADLLDRLLPGALELQDLGAMHAARASEGNDLRLRITPSAKC